MDDAQIGGIQERTRTAQATELARESIRLMDWASNGIANGGQLVLIDPSGRYHQFDSEALNRAQY